VICGRLSTLQRRRLTLVDRREDGMRRDGFQKRGLVRGCSAGPETVQFPQCAGVPGQFNELELQVCCRALSTLRCSMFQAWAGALKVASGAVLCQAPSVQRNAELNCSGGSSIDDSTPDVQGWILTRGSCIKQGRNDRGLRVPSGPPLEPFDDCPTRGAAKSMSFHSAFRVQAGAGRPSGPVMQSRCAIAKRTDNCRLQ
jgi:hypothetical protein